MKLNQHEQISPSSPYKCQDKNVDSSKREKNNNKTQCYIQSNIFSQGAGGSMSASIENSSIGKFLTDQLHK